MSFSLHLLFQAVKKSTCARLYLINETLLLQKKNKERKKEKRKKGRKEGRKEGRKKEFARHCELHQNVTNKLPI